MTRRILWMMSGVVLVGVVVSAVYLVWAGNIDSGQGPDNVASRMYTLKNIYDYLTDVDNAPPAKSASATFVEPVAGPGSTMNTTDDIFENLTRFPATGETSTYTTDYPNLGDTDGCDGSYQRGATKRYEYSDDGAIDTQAENICIDVNTGLMWIRDHTLVDGSGGVGGNQNISGGMFWKTAIQRCEDLEYASYTDWRLPNIYELYSICKLENTIGSPYIDTSCFPNTFQDAYWSSTTRPNGGINGLYVHFNVGSVGDNVKDISICVRAVRGGR